MGVPGYPEAFRVLCQDAGADPHRVLAAACGPVPARDPVVYLADFAHEVLFPLAAGVTCISRSVTAWGTASARRC